MTETEMWMRRQNQVRVPPAKQWRKLPFALDAPTEVVGHTRLQQRLRSAGVHDQGAGATLHSLERLGLIKVTKDRVEVPGVGEVDRTLVEITRRGRACARAGLGEPAESPPPAHLLSEWLWGVLLRVAAAGPEGLHESELTGKSLFYLAVGYRPKRQAHPSRGFIELRPGWHRAIRTSSNTGGTPPLSGSNTSPPTCTSTRKCTQLRRLQRNDHLDRSEVIPEALSDPCPTVVSRDDPCRR